MIQKHFQQASFANQKRKPLYYKDDCICELRQDSHIISKGQYQQSFTQAREDLGSIISEVRV